MKINLLLSDVDMPEMSGPDLGELLKKARPDMHCLVESMGICWFSTADGLFQKPLIASKLVQMVTDVLHSENRSQLGGQEFDSRKDTLNPH